MLAVKRYQIFFEGELADNACRQITIKVIDPVLSIRPSAVTLFRAVYVEWLDLHHRPERHHLLRESRLYLANALYLALRRKQGNPGILTRCQTGDERKGEDKED
jgi:hypothetical protein